MSIQVQFLSLLGAITGVGRVELEPAHRTVGEVLKEVARLYPALQNELFDEEGRLDYLYQVVLNGEKLEWSGVLEEPVKDGDRLQIFAVLAGG